jgi:hypothetical protein
MDLDELIDFDDWTDVRLSLAPWAVAHDGCRVALLRDADTLAVLERDGAWRARHRRELHRLGFRSRPHPHGRIWEWTVPEQALQLERSHQRGFGDSSLSLHPAVRRLRTALAQDRLLGERAVVVLRDVFRLTPADVRLSEPVTDDAADDEWAHVV